MQINTSCEMSDDSFEYFNTCKSPLKWISTCLLTSPSHEFPEWGNYKKTFRSHFISISEKRLIINFVKKNIENALTIHKEKYGANISEADIKSTVIWCCQQQPNLCISSQEELIKLFT
jgi:hypothetical protein|uniref:Uncharacterized protein n=1 Tax=viral metagenome TaxID=1070528 RepID=A0A6C0BVG2_9ZZZZ